MHYSFNSMVGRVTPTSRNGAYSPQGLQSNIIEPKPVVYATKGTALATENPAPLFSSQAGSSAASQPAKGYIPSMANYQQFRRLQDLFTYDDNRWVWQKRSMDRPMMLGSAAIMFVGFGLAAKSLYDMAYGVNKRS